MSEQKTERRFTRKEAADYVKKTHGVPISPNTFQKYATTGGGPRYRLFGNRAIYTDVDLDKWVENKLSLPRSSTSDAA